MPTPRYSRYEKYFSLIGDITILIFAFFLGYYIRFGKSIDFAHYEFIALLLIYIFTWWIIKSQRTFILSARGVQYYDILSRHFSNMIIHGSAIVLAIVLLHFYGISRLMVLYAFICQFFLILIWRSIYYYMLKAYRKAGYNFRNVIILGLNENALELYKVLSSHNELGYRILGFFDKKENLRYIENAPVYDLDSLDDFVKNHDVDEIFYTYFENENCDITKIVSLTEHHMIRFRMVPEFMKYIKRKVSIDFIDHIPVLLLREEPLENLFNRALKRTFDILFSSLVIIFILSWLIPIIGILIKIESKGPVFFKQLRTGRDNEEFYIFKFRSMLMNDLAHTKQATLGDSRVTRFGRFLRKSSLDEFPQFINVLTGDMSIVGPRPHMIEHTRQYSIMISQYMVRHFVKPGITGWAQVNGFRGETTGHEKMGKRIKLDVWYLENWTIIFDFFIILKTIGNVFKGDKNAH